MRVRDFHRGNDGAMAVIPLPAMETHHLPHARQGPVGRHQQIRFQRLAVVQLQQHARGFQPRAGLQRNRTQQTDIGSGPDPAQQRADDGAIFHDMAQFGCIDLGAVELDLPGTLRIPHGHVVVSTVTVGGDRLPRPQFFQKRARARRQCADPGIEAVHVAGQRQFLRVERLRLDQCNGQARAAEGDRQGGSGDAGTDNHDIKMPRVSHSPAPNCQPRPPHTAQIRASAPA